MWEKTGQEGYFSPREILQGGTRLPGDRLRLFSKTKNSWKYPPKMKKKSL
jgi:hypothetical protein